MKIKTWMWPRYDIPERSDPPTIRSLFVVRGHRVGIVYDLNEIDQTGIMDPHGPAHPGRKRKRNRTGVGRPGQSASLMDSLK